MDIPSSMSSQNLNVSLVPGVSAQSCLAGTGAGDLFRSSTPVGSVKSDEQVIFQVISCQASLSRFANARTRAAFLAGLFECGESTEEMLVSIDRIREMVIPSDYRTDVAGQEEDAAVGRNFFYQVPG